LYLVHTQSVYDSDRQSFFKPGANNHDLFPFSFAACSLSTAAAQGRGGGRGGASSAAQEDEDFLDDDEEGDEDGDEDGEDDGEFSGSDGDF
jgi:hypothetical protein